VTATVSDIRLGRLGGEWGELGHADPARVRLDARCEEEKCKVDDCPCGSCGDTVTYFSLLSGVSPQSGGGVGPRVEGAQAWVRAPVAARARGTCSQSYKQHCSGKQLLASALGDRRGARKSGNTCTRARMPVEQRPTAARYEQLH